MYKIGQLRRNDIEIGNYATNISYEQKNQSKESDVGGGIFLNFSDVLLDLGLNRIDSEKVYYLEFKVKHLSSVQDFSIILRNSEISETEAVQKIRTFKTPVDSDIGDNNDEYTSYELIFRPNSNYNQLWFELTRNSNDFISQNPGSENQTEITGRVMKIDIVKFQVLKNVLTELKVSKGYDDLNIVKKLGIQSAPGFLFTLDGEEIRVGRSGIYELNHEDIQVQYIGFVIKKSLFTQGGNEIEREDFFIMDFKY